ncbi:hypothetical protein Bmul_2082 [Burkholderia multivorans ATCC 17616]|nr:hypothetical protein Bmul_2082 [Burkholderia multivorans ATCC 17616]
MRGSEAPFSHVPLACGRGRGNDPLPFRTACHRCAAYASRVIARTPARMRIRMTIHAAYEANRRDAAPCTTARETHASAARRPAGVTS